MCLDWHVLPADYDRLPRHARREMTKFWRWHKRREAEQIELARLNARFGGRPAPSR